MMQIAKVKQINFCSTIVQRI